MLWQGRRESGNVEDRRGIGGPVAVGGGIIGVIVLVLNFLLGGNGDTSQLPVPGAGGQSQQLSPQEQQAEDQRASFARVVLADLEDVWGSLFQKAGSTYQPPTMTLFRGGVQSGCGNASAASGPFYCFILTFRFTRSCKTALRHLAILPWPMSLHTK
jgi:uncharacterized protein